MTPSLPQTGDQWTHMALEAAQLTAWSWDLASGVITYSASEGSYFRLPPGQFTRPIEELYAAVYPPDLPAFRRALAAARERGEPYRLEVRARAPDGELCWLEARGLMQRDEAGRPARIVGVTRDISAERRRDAAQAFQLAISAAMGQALDLAATLELLARLPLPELADTCAIMLLDDAGRLQPAAGFRASPAGPLPLEAPPAPPAAAEALRAGAPTLLAEVPPQLAPALGSPAPCSAMLVPLAAHGQTLGVLQLGLTSRERRYGAGDLELARALARRAAEAIAHARLRAAARAAEQAAAAAHARLDALVRSAPSGIGYLDHELRYVLVNPALAALSGRAPAEHLGRTMAEVLPELAPLLEAPARRVLATGAPERDIEVRGGPWAEGDGRPTWLVSYFPVTGAAGEVAGVGVTVAEISARRRTEAELRASQQNLASLIENTDGSIWSADAQYRLIAGNARFQRNVSAAIGRELRLGESLVALPLPQEALDEWRAWYDRALAGERFSVEVTTRFSAEPRIEEYRFSPIRAADGAVAGLTVFGRDVTERLRAEQALRDTERKLGTLFAILPVGISILDASGEIVYVNRALEQILRLDRAGLLRGAYRGRSYLRGDGTPMPPDEFASARALRERRPVADVETGVVTETGERIWASVSAAPVDFPDWRVVIVTSDITARKQTEAALRASTAKLEAALNSMTDAVFIADAEGRFLEFNAAFATFHRFRSRDECVRSFAEYPGLFEVFTADGAPAPVEQWAVPRALRGETASNAEFAVRRRDTGETWVGSYSFAPIRGPGGAIAGAVVVARDITERRAVEAQARAALEAEQAARLAAEAATERTARLLAVTSDLAGALSQEAVVEVVTSHVLRSTGASAGMIARLEPADERLELIGWVGQRARGDEQFQSLPLDAAAPAAAAARAREPVWLSTREQAEAAFPGLDAVMRHFDAHALATLPLLTAEGVLGTMSFSYAAPHPFTAEERTFLQILAQQCAQALERASLYAAVVAGQARLQQLSQRLIEAQEHERRHLARELHDEVGQALTGLRLALELAGRLPPEERSERLSAAHRATQELIARIRALSLDLRPAMLDDRGLLPALLWQLRRYQEQTGVAVTLRHQGLGGRLPPAVETVAYRVVQEALTNIARHAGVAAATVSLLASPDQLLVQVRDAGRGFDLAAALASGRSSGLAGMQERVALLGGGLSIETAPGAGTTITADLPLGEEAPR